MLTGMHYHKGREKAIMGYRKCRAFNQDMENRQGNLTVDANRGSLTSHHVCKTSMTNTETEQGNF